MEVEKKRKFHDAWAFILYLLFTIATSALIVLGTKNIPASTEKILLPVLFSTVAALLGFVLVVFLALRYMAQTFIFFVNAVLPVIAFSLLLFTLDPFAIILGALFLAVSLWFYFVYTRPVLPLIGAVVQTTSKIMASSALGCLLVLTFSASVQILQASIFLKTVSNTKEETAFLSILFTFNNYWTTMNVIYFTQVLVSGIVINYILSENMSFGKVVSSSLAALGSTSFASLIVAVIYTARSLVRGEAARTRREGGGLLKTILFFIAITILSVIGELVNTMNELAFPYLALHGSNYTESVRRSYNLISEKRGLTLLSNLAIGKVIGFCFFLFLGLIAASDVGTVLWWNMDPKDPSVIFSIVVVNIPALLFALEFLSMFSSGCLALIYTYLESPSSVEKIDPELVMKMRSFE